MDEVTADCTGTVVYYCSQQTAEDVTILQRLHINMVVRLTKEPAECGYLQQLAELNIRYRHHPTNQDSRLDGVIRRVSRYAKGNRVILVHCKHGLHRSPAVATAVSTRAKAI